MDRVQAIANHLAPAPCSEQEANETQTKVAQSITVIDNRNGRQIDIPLEGSFVPISQLTKLQLRSFDPGYTNTASARSSICSIDGEKGELRYRGYKIETLCESSSFVEVSYLLIFGELPTRTQNLNWHQTIMRHTFLHQDCLALLQTFRYDAHPMGQFISAISALGTFYPEANPALQGAGVFQNEKLRMKQIIRIIAKVPTIAACAYRHRMGRPFNKPNAKLGYVENFLYMMDRLDEPNYIPNPRLVRILEQLFIIHAEHEMNASTAAMRHIGSTMADPYTAVASAAAALYGPYHGGANEAVLRMLEEIGTIDQIPQFLEDVKNRKRRLMGFGHRVYRSGKDPRANIIRKLAFETFSIMGEEPLMTLALALEEAALKDDYFISRKIYPNVDFFSGLIYRSIGLPTDIFPLLFAIPRCVGWLAHWLEQLDDPETKIARPRQIYQGSEPREYVTINNRTNTLPADVEISSSAFTKRRDVSRFS